MSSSPYRPYAADFSEKYHWSALPTARIPMTEHAWLTSTDPSEMLRHLDPGNARVGKVSDPDTSHLWTPRRLRLFAAACCRQVWHLLVDDAPCERCGGEGTLYGKQGYEKRPSGLFVQSTPELSRRCPDCSLGHVNRSHRAVEVAERYAEGRATDEELEAACGSMATVGHSATFEYAPAWACHDEISYGVRALVGAGREWPAGQRAIQADLLRCVFGNPFRLVRVREPLTCSRGHADWAPLKKDSFPVPLSACRVCHEMGPPWPDVERGKAPAWLTPAVVSLARAVHAERDWAALPVLGDLLETEGFPTTVTCQECDGTGWLAFSFKGGPIEYGPEIKYVLEPPKQCMCLKCAGAGRVPNPLLAHLRSSGPHALGCHALDVILGGTTP